MTESIDDILTRLNLWPPDPVQLATACREAVVALPAACKRYQAGDTKVVNILMGRVMQLYPGALPANTIAVLQQYLNEDFKEDGL